MLKKRIINILCFLILIFVLIGGYITLKNLQNKIITIEKDNKTLIENVNKEIDKNKNLKKEIEKVKGKNDELYKRNVELKSTNTRIMNEVNKLSRIPNWNPDNVAILSNSSKYQLRKVLKHTNLSGLENYYLKAEKTYGINALFLVGITACESGWGNSQRAKYQNNLSGFAVYTSSSRGAYFDNKGVSIMETAKLLRKYYVNKGLNNVWSINKVYCPVDGFHWSKVINNIVYNDLRPYMKINIKY